MLPVTATSRDHAICSYYFCYHNSNNINYNYYYYDYYYYDYCCKNISRGNNNSNGKPSYSNEEFSQ